MVIVPKSTLHNWLNEFRRWCPVIKAVKFHGNAEERVRSGGSNCSHASTIPASILTMTQGAACLPAFFMHLSEG